MAQDTEFMSLCKARKQPEDDDDSAEEGLEEMRAR